MFHLITAAFRLARLGVLGMNRRNAEYILDHNPRARFPLVDDKLRLQRLCRQIEVPTPQVYGALDSYSQLRRLPELLKGRDDFVIKPNRGSGGRGILVVVGRDGTEFIRHNGQRLRLEDLRQHISDTLSGMFSLGGHPDAAIIQQRVQLHPAFDDVTFKGIPDVRVIVYRDEPAMAMLRLPTMESGGRANLHQGGLGAGIDLESGVTHRAVQRDRAISRHPDTGQPVVGVRVPYWREVITLSRKVASAVGLGYVGVDVVIDANHGPLLLEANARPGLAIQIANGRGLVPRLDEIDEMLASRATTLPIGSLRDTRAARQAA